MVVVRAGQRKERERRPVADEDGAQRDPVIPRRAESQDEEKAITEADLRKGVLESPVRHFPGRRAQEHAQQDEDERPAHRMPGHRGPGLPLRGPASDRVREGDADEERKGRLNQIVQRGADPFDVALVPGEKFPESTRWHRRRDPAEVQDLGHHEEHDEAAVGVDRCEPGGRRRGDDDGGRGRHCVRGKHDGGTHASVSMAGRPAPGKGESRCLPAQPGSCTFASIRRRNLLKPQMDQLSFRGCERERERVAAGHDLEAVRHFLSSGGPTSVEADGLA